MINIIYHNTKCQCCRYAFIARQDFNAGPYAAYIGFDKGIVKVGGDPQLRGLQFWYTRNIKYVHYKGSSK